MSPSNLSPTILSAESFVDLDVPVWAWVFLAATIATITHHPRKRL